MDTTTQEIVDIGSPQAKNLLSSTKDQLHWRISYMCLTILNDIRWLLNAFLLLHYVL
jgi:hypothetical protein